MSLLDLKKELKTLRNNYLINLVIYIIFCISTHFFIHKFSYVFLGFILLLTINLNYQYKKYQLFVDKFENKSYLKND